jgi:hypothetical protein
MKIILEGDGRTNPKHFDPELLQLLRENDSLMAEIFETVQDQSGSVNEAFLHFQSSLPPKAVSRKKREEEMGEKRHDYKTCIFE